ncbi:hypothetical protein [Saccharothrix algeriensis]|uniref:HAF family extracellular repeat protein n=1 Tax=Saccharothrix algeriensis TaxID=173560 RepID=A0A8T8HVR6_9PSEU|nr:hypothetical protein [Saccharothrix algeriensis]MBM7814342.1 putative HAF family extracellular repeat protein [Saccharothrix algeriensis]QTR02673.1 hypothetical protein J7S33_27000 [Saccharothrix algeriensis]
MPHSRLLVPLLLAVALPLLGTPAAHAADRVRITELPALPGQTAARVTAVDDLGRAIGASTGNGPQHAVLWHRGRTTDLGGGEAVALNRHGQVLVVEAPSSGGGTYVRRPRIWHDGTATDITPPGSGYVVAQAINAGGDVPMTYSRSPYGYHQEAAALWKDGALRGLDVGGGAHLSVSAITDGGLVAGSHLPMFGTDSYAFRCQGTSCGRLPAAPGSGSYAVSAANESGVVVGTRDNRPLRWEGDSVTVLPGGVGAVARNAQAINERGDVVGWTQDADGVRRATVWRGGQPVVLDVPGPSEAVAVNDRGDVVGWSSSTGQWRAFLWRHGRVVELGALGGASSYPVALNERGVVVGHATKADGTQHAVRWQVSGRR